MNNSNYYNNSYNCCNPNSCNNYNCNPYNCCNYSNSYDSYDSYDCYDSYDSCNQCNYNNCYNCNSSSNYNNNCNYDTSCNYSSQNNCCEYDNQYHQNNYCCNSYNQCPCSDKYTCCKQCDNSISYSSCAPCTSCCTQDVSNNCNDSCCNSYCNCCTNTCKNTNNTSCCNKECCTPSCSNPCRPPSDNNICGNPCCDKPGTAPCCNSCNNSCNTSCNNSCNTSCNVCDCARPILPSESITTSYPNVYTKTDKMINICQCHYFAFMSKANVVGLGLGYKITRSIDTGILCIQVYVTTKLPEHQLKPEDIIPSVYCGFPTDVIETGLITALALDNAVRPMPGGYSIGPATTNQTGTAGCLVTDGTFCYILSTNHIIADRNNADLGTAILQPSVPDGGTTPNSVIATLSNYVPLQFVVTNPCTTIPCVTIPTSTIPATTIPCWPLPCIPTLPCTTLPATPMNEIDAAIARVLDPSLVCSRIALLGNVSGASNPQLNLKVKKTGRTTGFTTGIVTGLAATVSVLFVNGEIAIFRNQIITTPMSAPGDSGSLLVDNNNCAIGLLFAGSGSCSVYNPIKTVLNSFKVNLATC